MFQSLIGIGGFFNLRSRKQGKWIVYFLFQSLIGIGGFFNVDKGDGSDLFVFQSLIGIGGFFNVLF